MKLSEIVKKFINSERGAALILPEEQVSAQAISATEQYAAYSDLESAENTSFEDINSDTQITISEWAVIRPLFLLYVERETALQLEATQLQGVTGYGRTSSEVESEIATFMPEFIDSASCLPIITIGGDIDPQEELKYPYGFTTY